MIIIGLTGPTGSGKTTASRTAKKKGFKVIDCDKVARVAVEKGRPALKELTAVFGEDILNIDGTLDRKALANKAFATPEATALLNKTVLPFIAELVIKESQGCERVLLDAPTLFESGLDEKCTATVAVLANMDTRLCRITARDVISSDAAILRINAGKSDDFYKERADYIIYNNTEQNKFIDEFGKIINEIINYK